MPDERPLPNKKTHPWVKDPEDFKYKWYCDVEEECSECGYNDSPCVIFSEGDYFCSEECMRRFEEEQEKWEAENEQLMREDAEECGPWFPFDDVEEDDEDV